MGATLFVAMLFSGTVSNPETLAVPTENLSNSPLHNAQKQHPEEERAPVEETVQPSTCRNDKENLFG